MLYTVALVSALALLAAADLLDAEEAAEVLPIMAQERGTVLASGWLFVLAPIFLAAAGLAFFMALRRAGSLTWVALLAFVGGSFLVLLRNVVWLAMTYELAPAYADAADADRATLASVGDTLISFGFIVGDLVGGVLAGGVGVLVFSWALLRTKITPDWVAWLGFVVAVTAGWFTLLAPLAEVFEVVSFIGLLGFWILLVALAVYLWGLPEHAGTGEAGAT